MLAKSVGCGCCTLSAGVSVDARKERELGVMHTRCGSTGDARQEKLTCHAPFLQPRSTLILGSTKNSHILFREIGAFLPPRSTLILGSTTRITQIKVIDPDLPWQVWLEIRERHRFQRHPADTLEGVLNQFGLASPGGR